MSDFISSKKVYANLQKKALGGAKVMHRVSLPVIRKEEDKHVLASFIFLFTPEELKTGHIKRPPLWVTADIESGEIIERYRCSENDFSAEPFDKEYFIRESSEVSPSAEYTLDLFQRLDEIRKEVLEQKEANDVAMREYIDLLLRIIPNEYQVFYKELSRI